MEEFNPVNDWFSHCVERLVRIDLVGLVQERFFRLYIEKATGRGHNARPHLVERGRTSTEMSVGENLGTSDSH